MTRAGQALTLQARHWEVSRKKARPSFGLGALGLLFSVADHVLVEGHPAFDLLAPNAPISLSFFASQCRHLRDALR